MSQCWSIVSKPKFVDGHYYSTSKMIRCANSVVYVICSAASLVSENTCRIPLGLFESL